LPAVSRHHTGQSHGRQMPAQTSEGHAPSWPCNPRGCQVLNLTPVRQDHRHLSSTPGPPILGGKTITQRGVAPLHALCSHRDPLPSRERNGACPRLAPRERVRPCHSRAGGNPSVSALILVVSDLDTLCRAGDIIGLRALIESHQDASWRPAPAADDGDGLFGGGGEVVPITLNPQVSVRLWP
jgi:hypothetical protein